MGENNTNNEQSSVAAGQKGIIPGFPHWSEKIPGGVEQEDIIKHYPNHLRGELLLQIATFWTPKEISTTSGQPTLKANTIAKRIKAAKVQKSSTDRKKTASAHRERDSISAAPKKPPAAATTPSQFFAESEASLKFRVEQQELQNIMAELDPTWACRQTTSKGRKRIDHDRELVVKADAERQRRLLPV